METRYFMDDLQESFPNVKTITDDKNSAKPIRLNNYETFGLTKRYEPGFERAGPGIAGLYALFYRAVW
ncbi:MAG: hypothetical protein HUN04_05605 [Desulfobacter sp.]|nr:MAG: hypothetical protein HUN04_05605 [Desulfobacter sp.]